MQRIPCIYFGPSPIGGRGVFTSETIETDTLIEICPVIVCNEGDLEKIHATRLHDYYFLWGEAETNCAIALGFGSLYNHSNTPNARYLVDEQEALMEIWTIRDIQAGEELTVSYHGDPDHKGPPLWFE